MKINTKIKISTYIKGEREKDKWGQAVRHRQTGTHRGIRRQPDADRESPSVCGFASHVACACSVAQ